LKFFLFKAVKTSISDNTFSHVLEFPLLFRGLIDLVAGFFDFLVTGFSLVAVLLDFRLTGFAFSEPFLDVAFFSLRHG